MLKDFEDNQVQQITSRQKNEIMMIQTSKCNHAFGLLAKVLESSQPPPEAAPAIQPQMCKNK